MTFVCKECFFKRIADKESKEESEAAVLDYSMRIQYENTREGRTKISKASLDKEDRLESQITSRKRRRDVITKENEEEIREESTDCREDLFRRMFRQNVSAELALRRRRVGSQETQVTRKEGKMR